jgi:type II secretory pathway pseudopilin PulG
MAIISILAAIVLFAASGVRAKVARSRAATEIQAISSAIDSYKTDNGIYPAPTSTSLATNSSAAYTITDPTTTSYTTNSQALYLALSGQTNFTDSPVGNKVYLNVPASMAGNANGATAGGSYLKDPYTYSYGYNAVGSLTGTFDLWSTGGLKGTASTNTAVWIRNWQ